MSNTMAKDHRECPAGWALPRDRPRRGVRQRGARRCRGSRAQHGSSRICCAGYRVGAGRRP